MSHELLTKERIIEQVKEAGRLYEQAKQSPSMKEAAEQRANYLCSHLADSIKEQMAREEQQETAAAAAIKSPAGRGTREAEKCQQQETPEKTAARAVDKVGLPSFEEKRTTESKWSLDYSRFDKFLVDEEDSDKEELQGGMKPRDVSKLAHRLAGVVEELKQVKPENSTDNLPDGASQRTKQPAAAAQCTEAAAESGEGRSCEVAVTLLDALD
eukprot:TRINITY_DN13255_c0_g1_i1.p1 TRINITY_DN13255_c0_g1~~TRINITY_DN13255_c0_g1_i1.p1  ORF type:complete len:227 (+),score=65.17 TRINITY_DN13255_c0_g1_i1:44-682(+)